MIISSIVAIVFVMMFVANLRMHKSYRAYKKLLNNIIDSQKSEIESHKKITTLQITLINEKDLALDTYKEQVKGLQDMISNMSEMGATDNGIDVEELEEEEPEDNEVVMASITMHPSLSTSIDMRSLRSNAMLTLYEVSAVLETERKNIPKATYEKLAKHLRLDS